MSPSSRYGSILAPICIVATIATQLMSTAYASVGSDAATKYGFKDYYEVSSEAKSEFVENGQNYRIVYKQYYPFKPSELANLSLVPNRSSEALILVGGNTYYATKGGYSIEKKSSFEDLKAKTLGYLEQNGTDPILFTDPEGNYSVMTSWKGYSIDPAGWYDTRYPVDISKSYIVKSGKDGSYVLTSSIESDKIIPASDLQWLENKEQVIAMLSRDRLSYDGSDFRPVFQSIKKKTQEVIAGKTTEEAKIRAIYSYVLTTIKYDQYSEDFINKWLVSEEEYKKNRDDAIFTGIGAFKNGTAVCSGISKLFLYMASFAGIRDVAVEEAPANNGSVYYDHAWNRIGNKYYDITFNLDARDTSLYYGLPKDVLYASRKYEDQDESVFRQMTMSQLQKELDRRFKAIATKYPKNRYSLLAPYQTGYPDSAYPKTESPAQTPASETVHAATTVNNVTPPSQTTPAPSPTPNTSVDAAFKVKVARFRDYLRKKDTRTQNAMMLKVTALLANTKLSSATRAKVEYLIKVLTEK